jgi:hypothetical protein
VNRQDAKGEKDILSRYGCAHESALGALGVLAVQILFAAIKIPCAFGLKLLTLSDISQHQGWEIHGAAYL